MKLTEDDRFLIEELSALSGIQKDVIREVFEFLFIRWAESISQKSEEMSDKKTIANIRVPYLGTVGIRYVGDEVTESGSLNTLVDPFIALSSGFRKMIGDTIDEGDTVVKEMLKRKIENAILAMKDN